MNVAAARPLTKREMINALRDDGAVFVRNRTGRNGVPEGDFVFSVTEEDNSRRAVTVPLTWLPIDLTHMVSSASRLKKSPEFRQVIDRGILELVPEAEALAIINSPRGQVEAENIQNRARRVEEGLTSPRGMSSPNAEPDNLTDTVAFEILARLRAGQVTEEKAIATLKALAAGDMIDDKELDTLMAVKSSEAVSKALADIKASRTSA